MNPSKIEPSWKQWLDNFLIIDFFIVLSGALWFLIAILLNTQGLQTPLSLFERVWKPIFTPAITILIIAAIINWVFDWFQQKVLHSDQDNEI